MNISPSLIGIFWTQPSTNTCARGVRREKVNGRIKVAVRRRGREESMDCTFRFMSPLTM